MGDLRGEARGADVHLGGGGERRGKGYWLLVVLREKGKEGRVEETG